MEHCRIKQELSFIWRTMFSGGFEEHILPGPGLLDNRHAVSCHAVKYVATFKLFQGSLTTEITVLDSKTIGSHIYIASMYTPF